MFPIPVTRDHAIRAYCCADMVPQQTNIRVRFRDRAGYIRPLEMLVTNPTAGALAFNEMRLEEGELISVHCESMTGTPQRGRLFCVVQLVNGFGDAGDVEQLLISNYVNRAYGISWPGSPLASPEDGRGYCIPVAPANPAAGAILTYTVPARYKIRPISCKVTLTTSVVVANRLLRLVLTKGGVVILNRAAQAVQAAGLVVTYRYYFGGNFRLVGNETEEPCPPDVYLYATHTIQFFVDNVDVADQLSDCVIERELWVPV